MVEMENHDEGVPFVFARSARQDFPAVMTMAAEHVVIAPPTADTEAGEPPTPGLLWPGPSGAAGLRFAPPARHLAVCGGDVATATEDEGSNMGWNPQGAGPLGHGVSRCAPPG